MSPLFHSLLFPIQHTWVKKIFYKAIQFQSEGPWGQKLSLWYSHLMENSIKDLGKALPQKGVGIRLDLGGKFERFSKYAGWVKTLHPFKPNLPLVIAYLLVCCWTYWIPLLLSGALASVSLILWTHRRRGWSCSSVWWSFRLKHSLGFVNIGFSC